MEGFQEHFNHILCLLCAFVKKDDGGSEIGEYIVHINKINGGI